MKPLLIAFVSALLGLGVGFELARREVGEVEPRLFPPAESGAAGAPATGPSVRVDAETYNFGSMQRGVTESHEFVFTNAGTAPLEIEVGQTTCKCTLGKVSGRPLPPGESTPVRLEWVAKSDPGEFRQVASVHTNDPRRPTVELTVEGQVTEAAGLEPDEFLVGRMTADSVGTASVFLASFTEGGEPVTATARLADGSRNAGRFRFDVEPVDVATLAIPGATSAVKITAHAGPGLPIGSLTEWVAIETNLASKVPPADGTSATGAVLQAPLFAIVEGDVSVHGARWSKERSLLNLGQFRSADGRVAKLRLSFKGEHAATLRASLAEADPSWIAADFGEPQQVRPGVFHQELTLRIPPGRPAVVRSGPGEDSGGIGAGDARLRVALNHPTTPELDVNVRFVIAD